MSAGLTETAELVPGAAELAEGERLIVTVRGREIGVFRIRGKLIAWENRCAHQGGPVCTGVIIGRAITVLADDKTVVREDRSTEELHLACPWHGWEFNVETGVCPAMPSRRLHRIELEERDGQVYARS
jgi:nitrite reductase (NADH) small subunit